MGVEGLCASGPLGVLRVSKLCPTRLRSFRGPDARGRKPSNKTLVPDSPPEFLDFKGPFWANFSIRWPKDDAQTWCDRNTETDRLAVTG